MKIAIHSLPRTGTKSLQINLHRYLKVTQKNVLCPDSPVGLGEPFDFTDDEYYHGTKKEFFKCTNTKVLFNNNYDPPVPLFDSLVKTLDGLLETKSSWVFKRHIFYKKDPILYQTLVNADRCIVVKRNDLFNHALSFALAHTLQIWNSGTALNNAIEHYSQNKLYIDPDQFTDWYIWVYEFYRFKWSKEFQIVNFNEMIQLNSAKEFCNFFNLESADFEFYPFKIEYGNSKFDMIKNIPELEEVALNINRHIHL